MGGKMRGAAATTPCLVFDDKKAINKIKDKWAHKIEGGKETVKGKERL